LLALPASERRLLGVLFREIARDADSRAEAAWKKRKGPMAAYWRATCTYARHIARAVDPRRPGAQLVPSAHPNSAVKPRPAGPLGFLCLEDVMAEFTIEATYRQSVVRRRTYQAEAPDRACQLAFADTDWSGRIRDAQGIGETYI
jgi:hypothetical protein